ncbi:MAG: YrdB family protein [Acidimicrobiales bacterium]
MTPPTMAGWNLALRFGLELGAFVGFGLAAWNLASGPVRWVAVALVPIAAAVIWGVFNVLDDPSRSGKAPVEVSGWTRLVIELLILGGGALGFAIAGYREIGIVLLALIIFHYAASTSRLRWLIQA